MSHPFRHFLTITKHRNRVIRNAFHMGIFFQALGHDLSKYGPSEFRASAKYYAGDHSPVYEQRLRDHYFSSICQHHTRHNKHHWEYWTDFFAGRLVLKTMPYRYAVEYVCDIISASMTYNGKASFDRKMPVEYFRRYHEIYHMTKITDSFIDWCLERYAETGWKDLKKKNTKAKYQELCSLYEPIEVVEQLHPWGELPSLKN